MDKFEEALEKHDKMVCKFCGEISDANKELRCPKCMFDNCVEVYLKDDAVAVYRLHCKKLLDFFNKNRPKFEKGMHCESWALNDVEKFFEELEGLLKK